MKMYRYVFCCAVILVNLKPIVFTISEDELDNTYGELIFASVVFRHGIRTPISTYPLDPHKNLEWKHGNGELTDRGKHLLYNIGKWFRGRYEKLTGNYDPLRVYMQSSNLNRTIESGQCFFTGYFPPTSSDAFYNFSWQPIPIHTIPSEIDNIIAMTKPCKAYNKEMHKLSRTPEFKKFYSQHADLIKYIETNTGLQLPKFPVLDILTNMYILYDLLKVEEENDLVLPNWTKSVYPEPFRTLAQDFFLIGSYNNRLKKLHTGPFLNSLKTDLINRKNNTSPLRLHLYAGHDTTIAAIMLALDIYNYILPPYGAALIFELRKKDDLNLLVLYKNSTEEPYLMKMPTSEGNTLDHFLNRINPLIPKKACT